MSGPFLTITVNQWNKLNDRIRELEKAIDSAEKSLPLGDPVGRLLREALRSDKHELA